jgi:hypothetical protein
MTAMHTAGSRRNILRLSTDRLHELVVHAAARPMAFLDQQAMDCPFPFWVAVGQTVGLEMFWFAAVTARIDTRHVVLVHGKPVTPGTELTIGMRTTCGETVRYTGAVRSCDYLMSNAHLVAVELSSTIEPLDFLSNLCSDSGKVRLPAEMEAETEGVEPVVEVEEPTDDPAILEPEPAVEEPEQMLCDDSSAPEVVARVTTQAEPEFNRPRVIWLTLKLASLIECTDDRDQIEDLLTRIHAELGYEPHKRKDERKKKAG